MTNLRGLYFSFPVRLLALHCRNHLILIGVWAMLLLMAVGAMGRFFGLHYLLLTPEYQGAVNFWSFFISGAAFGALVMIWNLTTYLLSANRFAFLATLEAPFSKFSFNNSIIPLLFLGGYLMASIWFQGHDELTRTKDIVYNVLGFLAGATALVLLLTGYLYLTNKDIVSFLKPGKFIPRPGRQLFAPGQRLPTIWEIQVGVTRWRVDTYFTERMKVRLVRSVAHYDQEMLGRVFRQNHFNAIVVQLVAIIILMLMGWFMDYSWVRIPTAAAIFLLASMVMALFGAITFWFRGWGLLVFLVLMVSVNTITGFGWFNYRNRAYGLDYRQENRVVYSNDTLTALCTPDRIRADKAVTIRILNNWLSKNQTPSRPKPKMIFVCTSGGGMRAALWTTQCLQQINKGLRGQLWPRMVLMSGASGGMLGAAYLREIYLREQLGENWSVQDTSLLDDVGKDLLNPVSFAIVANDVLLPLASFKSGNFEYRKDRGYLFERQLRENYRGLLNGTIADYRRAERRAMIPMMVLTPYVLNDARRLIISSQPVSYLMQPPDNNRKRLYPEIDGVDFGQFFTAQQADSLRFTTALRMNCTFPIILPNVWMPTRPSIEIMDAGVRDNYGIATAARFIHVFRDWIEANTDGVVIVQIRCFAKNRPVAASDTKGIVQSLFTPAGAAGSLTDIQDFDQDNTLALLEDLLGAGRLEVVRFMYRPVNKKREASMSLHLSKREKIDLKESFFLPENKAALKQLKAAIF